MRMLWLGFLIIISLIFSFTGFIEADDGSDDRDNYQESQHQIVNPAKIIDITVGDHDHVAEIPKVPTEEFEINIVEKEKYINEHHKQLQEEAVEHMSQVAEESEQSVKEVYDENANNPDINVEVEIQEEEVKGDDVLEAEYVGRRTPEGKENEGADDMKWVGEPSINKDYDHIVKKMKKQALKNVKMLRRSDRSEAEVEEKQNKTKRVYVSALPRHHGIPIGRVIPEKDTGYVEKVVFLNSDSHVHVAHKNKNYATLVKHDEF